MSFEKFLVVGFGSAGKRHLDLARSFFPKAIIKIYTKRIFNDVPEFSNGILKSISEIDEFGPDVIIISNPSSLHLKIARHFIKRNIHFFIEKPISDNFNDAKSFFEEFKQELHKIFVGYNLRFLEAVNIFKKNIEQNKIGKILSFRAEAGKYLPDWRPNVDYKQGVSANKSLGGGVLLELSHEIDYLIWIFGNIRWVKSAVLKQSDLDVDVEDSAHIIIAIESAKNKDLVGTLNIDFIRRDPIRLCYAIGQLGTIRMNLIEFKVDVYSVDSGWVNLYSGNSEDMKRSYVSEWQAFINSIKFNKQFEVSFEDGLAVLKCIELIRNDSNL